MKGHDDFKTQAKGLLRWRVCLDLSSVWRLHRPPSTVYSATGRPVCLWSWGLHRPPSTVCSGTGRPVCLWNRGLCRFSSTITSPTMLKDSSITLRAQLGDYSYSYIGTGFMCKWEVILLLILDLATRFILCLPASPGTTLVRCIWRCILASKFLRGFFFLDPCTTCLRHLLPGSGTKWAHFTLRWICLFFMSVYFLRKVKWAHFIRKEIFFDLEHHALFEQSASSMIMLINCH